MRRKINVQLEVARTERRERREDAACQRAAATPPFLLVKRTELTAIFLLAAAA
jgi:hypothetical protein